MSEIRGEVYLENGIAVVGSNYPLSKYNEETDTSNYPIEVTLRFKSQEDKEYFLAGLCDGWGENYCDPNWRWRDGEELVSAKSLNVDVFRDESEGLAV